MKQYPSQRLDIKPKLKKVVEIDRINTSKSESSQSLDS